MSDAAHHALHAAIRDEFVAGLEAAKEENLKIKLQIIEELKELA